MGRSNETFNKKNVRDKKEKKRKEKEKKKLNKKEGRDGNNLDDMIAYVDEFGNITSTPPDPTLKKTIIKAEDIQLGVPKSLPQDPADLIRKGTVTFFNDSKGYGFIKDIVTQESIFVHANGCVNQIKENNRVTFEVVRGPKGLNAVNVKLDQQKDTPTIKPE